MKKLFAGILLAALIVLIVYLFMPVNKKIIMAKIFVKKGFFHLSEGESISDLVEKSIEFNRTTALENKLCVRKGWEVWYVGFRTEPPIGRLVLYDNIHNKALIADSYEDLNSIVDQSRFESLVFDLEGAKAYLKAAISVLDDSLWVLDDVSGLLYTNIERRYPDFAIEFKKIFYLPTWSETNDRYVVKFYLYKKRGRDTFDLAEYILSVSIKDGQFKEKYKIIKHNIHYVSPLI